jgi:hypothetical protein
MKSVTIIMHTRFDETLSTIIPLIEPLSKDVEPVVKQHLVEQLKGLSKVQGYNISQNLVI